MIAPLAVFILAVIIPLFLARTASAPGWLSLQAVCLAVIAMTAHEPFSLHAMMAAGELLLVRAVLVPAIFRRALRQHATARTGLMPSNLFSWSLAMGAVLAAFQFAGGFHGDARSLTVGAVAVAVVSAFLILATNRQLPAQLAALMIMENAVAMFESLLVEPWSLPVHLALGVVYLLTGLVGSWLVRGAAVEHPSNRVGELL